MKSLLNEEELKQLSGIREKYYMKPILSRIDKFINKTKSKKDGWKNIFDSIHNYMIESKNDVEKLLIEREKSGLIKSKDQARKSIAGAVFSNTIIYIFIHNKEVKNISSDIYITSKHRSLKGFDKISTIHVDTDTQKPDCDLVIYKLKEDKALDRCMIVSLKTLLNNKLNRLIEWKLLLDIIKNDDKTRRKFKIKYRAKYIPLIALINQNNIKQKKSNNNVLIDVFDKYFIANNNICRGNKLSEIINTIKINFQNITLCLR